MNETKARPLIVVNKHPQNWSGFQARSNHRGHVIGVAQVSGDDGVFIPGLTVEIEAKAPLVTDQCLYHFSLRQRSGKLREVVYQLEVCPSSKRSHNGAIVLYGPHEHVGDSEPTSVHVSDVSCNDWDGCLRWFLARINLSPFLIEKP